MCGRFSQTQTAQRIAQVFQLSEVPEVIPSYNIAPTQSVATIVKQPDQPQRQFRWLRWGLVPSWAKDEKIGARLINARAETLAEKPSFRTAYRYRRCLVLADGFYEWQLHQGQKQPFYFHLPNQPLFAFAGLWEQWQGNGEAVESCTIVTTSASDEVRPIHDRMPLILEPDRYDEWLNPESHRPNADLLHPVPNNKLEAYPVSPRVNSPAVNDPDCIQPLSVKALYT